MRIVITGGNGKLGRYLARELSSDHEITVVDVAGGPEDGVRFIKGDLLDFDLCKQAVDGAEAVVHLAAIPHPLTDPQQKVWRVNVCSTYNIHEAAAQCGVRRVVQASSDSTLGFCFMERRFDPEYLPFDEAHPLKPQDSYGLSKVAGEEIARSFTQRCGLETVALRICLVLFPDVEYCQNVVRDRKTQPTEFAKNLWTYNHVLDVCQAFRLAVETPSIEHETMFISARNLLAREPTIDLIEKYMPDVTDLRADFRDHMSLVNILKARHVLGYEPQHDWTEIPTC